MRTRHWIIFVKVAAKATHHMEAQASKGTVGERPPSYLLCWWPPLPSVQVNVGPFSTRKKGLTGALSLPRCTHMNPGAVCTVYILVAMHAAESRRAYFPGTKYLCGIRGRRKIPGAPRSLKIWGGGGFLRRNKIGASIFLLLVEY